MVRMFSGSAAHAVSVSGAGIVVGAHRVESSGPAVRWAAVEAALRAVPLTVLHAWAVPVDVGVTMTDDPLTDGRTPMISRAVYGSPEAVLLSQPAELLVLGVGADARHASHVIRACVHRASCPIVVVPHSDCAPARRVVVGVCCDAHSAGPLRWAAQESAIRRADLVVLHARQLQTTSPRDVLACHHAAVAQPPHEAEHLGRWVRESLGSSSATLRAVHGAPLDILLEAARSADLVVVGRGNHRGHGMLADADLDLCTLSPCPVAIIPEATSATS